MTKNYLFFVGKRTLFIVLVVNFFYQIASAIPTEVPIISHYSLKLKILPKQGRFEAEVTLKLNNITNHPQTEIPLLLYRLLEVKEVVSEHNRPLKFGQKVVRFPDAGLNNLQVTFVTIQLKTPQRPKTQQLIKVKYDGSIYGYAEVMGYVHDKISEDYSLLRPDALAYPMLSYPTAENWLNVYKSLFTYDLTVTVPKDYIAACGGLPLSQTTNANETTFVFKSSKPTWRMDIGVAKFKLFKDEGTKLQVYALPADEKGAINVLNASKKAISLYSGMFGEIDNYQGYTVIEIPEGWGSQASDFYFLQSAEAFNNPESMPEVYHEIAHTWNAKTTGEVQRSRYFDEAFASYFQAIAVREFDGEKAYEDLLSRYWDSFIRNVERDKINAETAIADYGKLELGRNSYTKGALSLYVLHQLLGEHNFRSFIRKFLVDFKNDFADFKDFQATAQKFSSKNLDKYFAEWIYGTESSQLLIEKVSIREIVKRY